MNLDISGRARTAMALVLVSMSLQSGSVNAQSTTVSVLKWDLTELKGSLKIVDSERISITNPDGSSMMVSPDDVAVLDFGSDRDPNPGSKGSGTGMIWLTDGTRHTGWPDIQGTSMVWRNWWSGTIDPDVEDIVAFDESSATDPPVPRSMDVVVMGNGDVVMGIVDSIGESVVVEVSEGDVVEFPLDRVRSLSLVNPVDRGPGTRAWLSPGDEVILNDYRYDHGTGFRVEGKEPLMLRQVRAIAFDASRVLPLAGIECTVSPLDEYPRFRVPRPDFSRAPSPLNAPPLTLRGPLRVEWDLPRTGMGLHARASLPESVRGLGSAEIVIHDGDLRVWSANLDVDTPAVTISTTIASGRLGIEIRESSSGPIGNAIRLDRALLLATPPVDPGNGSDQE